MLKFELNHAEELERPKNDVLAETKVLQPSSIWEEGRRSWQVS